MDTETQDHGPFCSRTPFPHIFPNYKRKKLEEQLPKHNSCRLCGIVKSTVVLRTNQDGSQTKFH